MSHFRILPNSYRTQYLPKHFNGVRPFFGFVGNMQRKSIQNQTSVQRKIANDQHIEQRNIRKASGLKKQLSTSLYRFFRTEKQIALASGILLAASTGYAWKLRKSLSQLPAEMPSEGLAISIYNWAKNHPWLSLGAAALLPCTLIIDKKLLTTDLCPFLE